MNFEIFLIELVSELSLIWIPVSISLLYVVFALLIFKVQDKKSRFLKYNFRYKKTIIVLLPALIIILFFAYPKFPNRTEYFGKSKNGINSTKIVYYLWKQKYTEKDSNLDGKIDYWQYRNSSGNIEREEFDNNFDGKPEFWAYYNRENIPVRIERDSNFDGVKDKPRPKEILDDRSFVSPDELSYDYLKNTSYYYSDGKLIKVENKFDGNVFMIDYYNYLKLSKSESYDLDGNLELITYYDGNEDELRYESYKNGKRESSFTPEDVDNYNIQP